MTRPTKFSLRDIDKRRAIVKAILAPQIIGKRDRTVESFYNRIEPGPDTRVHTVLSPDTASNRLSSNETMLFSVPSKVNKKRKIWSTNLQNQPKKVARLDPLYRVRDCFIPDKGMVLVAVDFKGAEAFCVAAYSKDWTFYEQLQRGDDVHTMHARLFYGLIPTDADQAKLQRDIAKTLVYASFYYASAQTLQRHINKEGEVFGIYLSLDEVVDFRAKLLQVHPLEQWWMDTKDELYRSGGILRNALGYRRVFRSPDPDKRLKDGLSFYAQSTVGCLMNDALPKAYDLVDRPGEVEILHQIHDELLFQARPEHIPQLIKNVTPLMERRFRIHNREVFIPTEWSSGEDWGHMKKIAA